MKLEKEVKVFRWLLPAFLILGLVAGSFILNAKGFSESKPGIQTSATFNSTIKLTEGKLTLSYSSTEEELHLECSFENREKEYQISLTSKERLGVLIIAEGLDLTYSIEFLQPDEVWDPLSDKPDENSYKKRARLHQKPGWEIHVYEKVESPSMT